MELTKVQKPIFLKNSSTGNLRQITYFQEWGYYEPAIPKMKAADGREVINWKKFNAMEKKPVVTGPFCRDCNKVAKRWYKHMKRPVIEDRLWLSTSIGVFDFSA